MRIAYGGTQLGDDSEGDDATLTSTCGMDASIPSHARQSRLNKARTGLQSVGCRATCGYESWSAVLHAIMQAIDLPTVGALTLSARDGSSAAFGLACLQSSEARFVGRRVITTYNFAASNLYTSTLASGTNPLASYAVSADTTLLGSIFIGGAVSGSVTASDLSQTNGVSQVVNISGCTLSCSQTDASIIIYGFTDLGTVTEE